MTDWGARIQQGFENPLFSFGVGMMGAQPGSTFGQALAQGFGAYGAQAAKLKKEELLKKQMEAAALQQEFNNRIAQGRLDLDTQRLGQQAKQAQDQLAQQASQFETGQAFKEQQLAQQQGQFEAGQDLKREQLAQQQGQFETELGYKTAVKGAEIAQEQAKAEQKQAVEQAKQAEKAKTDLDTYKSKVAGLDNSIDTTARILQTPMSVVGAAAGPISSRMPTLSQSTADFEALIETLSSQAFTSQIQTMKGMGSLSDAEGKKIASATQNLSLTQSPEQLMKNVKIIQDTLLAARKRLATEYNVEQESPLATPSVEASPNEVQSILDMYLSPGI